MAVMAHSEVPATTRGPLSGADLMPPAMKSAARFDPEQTSAPCWISMSRTQQLFDVCRTPQVRQ
jgi:hypothetical protein